MGKFFTMMMMQFTKVVMCVLCALSSVSAVVKRDFPPTVVITNTTSQSRARGIVQNDVGLLKLGNKNEQGEFQVNFVKDRKTRWVNEEHFEVTRIRCTQDVKDYFSNGTNPKHLSTFRV